MKQQLNPGDVALIVGAEGSHHLIGHSCTVLQLHQGMGEVAYRGVVTTCDTAEPCAWIEPRDGQLRLWSLRYLMPLKGDAAERSWRKREVSHA